MPMGPISRLETNQEYAKVFRKFPDLVKRQREIDERGPAGFRTGRGYRSFWPPLPIYQMYDLWLAWGLSEEYLEIGADGKMVKIRLGPLTMRTYNTPPMGVLMRDYKQPEADLVKPVLFCIDDRFYSVYGDCQVAGHVPVEGYPDDLAALRYAGNPLYACSKELPPPLQSCGVDKEGVIWLADREGHVAFFRTKSLDFVRKCTAIEGVTRLLIPRDNQSRAMFAFNGEKKVFQEYQVEVGGEPTVPAAPRVLPSDTGHVLYCDAERVVFLTTDSAVIWQGNTDDTKLSTSLKLEKGAVVWDAVYLAKMNQVALLSAPISQPLEEIGEYGKLEEVERSWDNLKLSVLTLPKGK